MGMTAPESEWGIRELIREQRADEERRNVVHDLKTPLTVIKGCIETLRTLDQAEDADLCNELMQAISEQSDRLLQDVQDLLTPVDSEWSYHRDRFDLALLLQQVVFAECRTARAAKHTILMHGADVPTEIVADRRKIRRVLENLLSNAVKYSPGTNQKVRVWLRREEDVVVVSISDDGIGMTADELQNALAGRGRVGNLDSGIEGSGYGLSSCRRILSAHGGSLRATSIPWLGSTFEAIIPLKE